MNTFGTIFRLTSFGESHGAAIGGVIDGVPAGIKISIDEIQKELDRRKPGQSDIVTQRAESDTVRILSGIFEGVTLGTSIGFIVENKDHHSQDYSLIKDTYRPSHADYTYEMKYGTRDYRGGGRSSARETIARVVAGAVAKQALSQLGINIYAYTSQIGEIKVEKHYTELDFCEIEQNIVRCADKEVAPKMVNLVREVKSKGDTIGGIITGIVKGVPVGFGEPVFDKINAKLGAAMLSINAVKGFEVGDGFDMASHRGSEVMDSIVNDNGNIHTTSNHSGGIQGGISNGEDIYFRVAFKPVATLLQDIETIDKNGNPIVLHPKGRHDPCVLPRAVPIVEAMAAMVIFDCYLMNKVSHL